MKVLTVEILCIYTFSFDSTDENKEVLQKYTEPWVGIENEIETINGGKQRRMW